MERTMEKLTPTFRNLSGRNLMVYTFPKKDEVIQYQLQMIVNNTIPSVLKASSVSLDDEVHLQYDITSLIPLKKLLERRKIGRMDFLELIKNITVMAEGLEQYLLDIERIVFDSMYIYADPQDLKLEFAYLPVLTVEHGAENLKSFLLNLVINDIRFADEQSDNFVQKLLEILKKNDFKASDLKEYIRGMGTYNQKAIPEPQNIIKPQVQAKENETALSVPTETRPVQNVLKPSANKSNSAIRVSKLCYPTRSYIIMGSVIGVLILFLIMLIASGIISPGNPDSLLSLFGFLMICGAVIYLVYSKVFSPDKKIEKKEPIQRAEYVNKAFSLPKSFPVNRENPPVKRQIFPDGQELMSDYRAAEQQTAVTSIGYAYPVGIEKPSILPVRENVPAKSDTIVRTDKHRDKTVILDRGKLNCPHLKRTTGNSFDTILLQKFPFMLGRLESQVDYCISNPAVGKLHAEIRKTQDGYVISDMNSLNGTYVNDERLEPGQDMIIKNGDRITLGNEEFVFYIER